MPATITRDDLRAAIDAGSVVVVDALPASYFEQAHLPGAINLVESQVVDVAPQVIPDRDTPIVTYCSNTACSNSTAVARLLERAGYTNVRTYPQGIQDWVEAGLAVEGSGAPSGR